VASFGKAGLDAYRIHLLWLGVIPFAERWEPEANGPAAWRLSFCDDVGASLHLGERGTALPARQVVLIPPTAAGAKPDGDVLHLLVQFQLNAATAEHAAALGRVPLVLVPDELRDRLCLRLRRDLAESAVVGSATCARAQALVHLSVAAALDLGSAALGKTPQADDEERQLRPVLLFIDAHLAEPLENARLAAFVHASESHFIRLFRRVVGCTPARHVQERRVRHAAELLAHTSLTIDEIAERCGFANRFHFSRVFLQRLSAPPGRYRALHASQTGAETGSAT
jgi:transcriptional regulator GlxA family with amidase domain